MTHRRQIRLPKELDEALKEYAQRHYRGNVNMAISYLLEAALGLPVVASDRPREPLGFVAPVASLAAPEVSPKAPEAPKAFDVFDSWVDSLGDVDLASLS